MNDPFITTYTGRKVNPLALKVEDICVEDIAHHLACLNRFVGALRRPVSVAQHSVYVSRLLEGTGWEAEGLFHDAPEAYLGDVSKWVKQSGSMAAYRQAEADAWNVICQAFKLNSAIIPCLDQADALMVRFEALQQSTNPNHLFERASHPCPSPSERARVGYWCPWTWQASERGFLDRYRSLQGAGRSFWPMARGRAPLRVSVAPSRQPAG